MDDEIKNRIDAWFQKTADETAALKAAHEAKMKKEEDCLIRFLDMAEHMIKPTLVQMAEYITSKGIKADVVIRGPKGTDRGVVLQHSVDVVFPESLKPGVTEAPYFKLVYSKPDQIVSLMRKTNDYNLPGERHTLDEITKEWIEDEFTKYFVKGL